MNRQAQIRTQIMTQTMLQARGRSGLSLREVARRAGTSHPTLLAYERGQKIPSVVVFMRILAACGMAVDFELSPRVREADGLDRGEELKQALLLTEQFPNKPRKTLNLAKFGRTTNQNV